jgi:hypothetical protein
MLLVSRREKKEAAVKPGCTPATHHDKGKGGSSETR